MRSWHKGGPRLLAAAALALFTLACIDDEPVAVGPDMAPNLARAAAESDAQPADHFLVEFGGSVQRLTAAVEDLGGTVIRTHSEIGLAMVGGLDDGGASLLEGASGVRSVTRDQIVPWLPDDLEMEVVDAPEVEGHVGGHDPTTAFYFPCQWNMSQCNTTGAWLQGQFGNPGVKVAVLDTGTDPFHVDLQGRIDLAQSVSMLSSPSICDFFVDDVGTINDYRFHGAFVSGIIAGNGIRVTGVAPRTQIVGVKVLNCLGSGSFGDVIAGILYAAGLNDVDVINMSLGARFAKNLPGAAQLVAALNKAVNFAGSQGVLVVSSAGNNGADLDHDRNVVNVPAQSGSGISVWAGDIDGNLAGYSNFGRSGTWVGAGGGDNTPGSPSVPLAGCVLPAFGHDGIVSVCSTTSLFFGCGGGATVLFNGSGTSFSAPLVAGVAALVDGKASGALNAERLKTILSRTADDLGKKGVDGIFSHGRVNAGNAVR